MRRIFGNVNGTAVTLDKLNLNHLKVVRLKVNEEIEVLSPTGTYQAFVSSLNPLTLEAKSIIEESRELPYKLSLIYAMPKKDKFEFVLQKAVELGVKEIIPFNSDLVIKRLTVDEFEKHRERNEAIINEAVLQSNRDVIPQLSPLQNMKEVLSYQADYKFIAYEEEALHKRETFFKEKIPVGSKIAIVIGAEGGFKKSEIDNFIKAGYQPISLGKRILRSETAAIASLAILGYELENNYENNL